MNHGDGKTSREAAISAVALGLSTIPETEARPTLREMVHLNRARIDIARREGRSWKEIATILADSGYEKSRPATIARFHQEPLSKKVSREQSRRSQHHNLSDASKLERHNGSGAIRNTAPSSAQNDAEMGLETGGPSRAIRTR